MAPPELARDAPVLDVAHPFEIGLGPALRDEADAALLDRRDGRGGERLGTHEPLVGQVGLDDGAAAIAARHHELVCLNLLQEPGVLQIRDDAPACLVAVQTHVGRRSLVVDAGIGGEDVDARKAMATAHLVVVEVVGRGDLQAARAELLVHHLIGDHRDGAARQGQIQHLSDIPPVTVVVGVHGDRDVAEHRLGPRGRDHQVALARGQRIADVPELARLLGRLDLEVRNRRVQHRVPVDQALTAIDQAPRRGGARTPR